MRITTNSALMTNSTDSKYDTVLPQHRDNFYYDSTLKIEYVNKTLPGYNYSSSGGYQDWGGFVYFIPGNTSLNESYS